MLGCVAVVVLFALPEVLAPNRAFSQQASYLVLGSIRDSVGAPLPRAFVYLDSGLTWTTTDSLGAFRLEDVEAGSHRLEVRRLGFEPRSFDLALREALRGEVSVGVITLDPGPPPAVTLFGVVLDSVAGEPVEGAQILLNGKALVKTDDKGRFRSEDVPVGWGTNLITVRRIGYEPVTDFLWVEALVSQFELSAVLQRAPIELPAVVVEDERAMVELGRLRDFWRRRNAGVGTFFTWREIRERNPTVATDLLREVPGVRVRRIGLSDEVLFLRRGGLHHGPSVCAPFIYVNGVRSLGLIDLDAYPPDLLAAIEVYVGSAGTPVQFDPTGNGCGAIVLWTK